MEAPIAEPIVAEPAKSSTQIEHDMEKTRESISVKVEALESQVLGTIQTATNTVTDTVDAVKDAVATAPSAVRETIQEIVQVVKESVGSISLSGFVRSHPGAVLGSSAFTGFLLGFLTGGRKAAAQPTAPIEPVQRFAASTATPAPAARTGLLAELFDRLGGEARQVGELILSKALASLKQNVETRVPEVVDSVVQRMTGSVETRTHGDANRNFAARVSV